MSDIYVKREVNLTKLIEDARRDIADAERCQALHITPATGALLRRLREVTDALEAGEIVKGSGNSSENSDDEPTDAQAWAAAQAVAELRKQETGMPSWFSVDHARAALRAAAAIQEGESNG